jgi:hypothetical protein
MTWRKHWKLRLPHEGIPNWSGGCVSGAGAPLLLASSAAPAQYATSVVSFTCVTVDLPTATAIPAAPPPFYKIGGGSARTNWTN